MILVFLVVGHYLQQLPPFPRVGTLTVPVGYAIVVLFVVSGYLVTTRIVAEHARSEDAAHDLPGGRWRSGSKNSAV